MPKTNFVSALLSVFLLSMGFPMFKSQHSLFKCNNRCFVHLLSSDGYQSKTLNYECSVVLHTCYVQFWHRNISWVCSTEIVRDFFRQFVRGHANCASSEPKCEHSGLQGLLLNKAFTHKQNKKQNLTHTRLLLKQVSHLLLAPASLLGTGEQLSLKNT